MSDPLDGFREYFPGSKTPIPVAVAPVKELKTQDTDWDYRPVKKIVKGKEVEFFTIGAVAKATGKSVVTIRHWIRNGNLPKAAYRMPDRNGIAGRRLYTRPQIEALVRVIKAHGLEGGVRVDWTKHGSLAAEIRAAWAALPPIY